MIQVGDLIPEVLGTDQNGTPLTRDALKGQKLILYFYPKDNTSGCTAEACSLRDGIQELTKAGFKVIGVSKDSAKSHQGFKEKHDLPFDLIADTETTLQQQVGVWVPKSMYGRQYMGTQRTTLLVDASGVVRYVMTGRDIQTKKHADQLLGIIRELNL